ncbi:hypothetical protein RUM43_000039 [Polyplax serrata]|uniref:Cell cycle checkpoint protein RAD1 n=1 Tax=Polyplax serrata TaxID=468196 RepID=A0AAN8SDD3_POLSC
MAELKRSDFDEEIRFGAKTYDVKLVIQILKAVKIKDNATFYCTNEGIKVTVEDMKCLQANAYLEVSLFEKYNVTKKPDEDFVKFTVNLSVVLDCLSILHNSGVGGATALVITYKGEGYPIILLMEHGGVITDCKIKTLMCKQILNFNFETSVLVNKVVLFSDSFKEVLNDLDTNSDILKISMSTDPLKLKLTTDGNGLISETDVPFDCQMVDAFQCSSSCQYSYKLTHLKPALKHLPGSQKVSVQINELGVLCLQYMIVNENGRNCFVEYFCLPLFKPSQNGLTFAEEEGSL